MRLLNLFFEAQENLLNYFGYKTETIWAVNIDNGTSYYWNISPDSGTLIFSDIEYTLDESPFYVESLVDKERSIYPGEEFTLIKVKDRTLMILDNKKKITK